MSDHVHLLLTVGSHGSISDILRDWKGWTAYELNSSLKRRGKLWQRDFWEHAVRNEKDFIEKLDYIHDNPVRAGYVQQQVDWPYSSASWYAGLSNPIKIDPLLL